MRSSHRDVMACICGTDLVVVARFLAAAVPRLSDRDRSSCGTTAASVRIDIGDLPLNP
jgi:hypothetical protein